MEDLELWKPRLDQRVREVQRLIDYIFTQPKNLGENVHYDTDNIFIAGHGFGGCTALAACEKEPI